MTESRMTQLLKDTVVEWKKLGDVCEIIKGKQFNKRDMLEEAEYPVINGGIFASGYVEVYNQVSNTITVSQGGASAGFVNFIETKFWLGAHAFAILSNEEVLNRYVYHFLKMNQKKIQSSQKGAGIPSVSKTTLINLEIPIPPLETQNEIVEILDKMTSYVTELTTELTTELALRRKQYAFYLDKLLTFPEEVVSDGKLSWHWTTLGEVGTFTRGSGLQKKDFTEIGSPVIHYGQIYTKYDFEADKTISFTSEEVFNKLKKARFGDIVMATTSENIIDVGKSVVWTGNYEIGISGDMCIYRTTQNAKYFAYYFQTNDYQRQKERKVTGTKVNRINVSDIGKIIIPLPDLKIQNKIVEILDRFQAMTENVSGLLPKEIEQRHKQYVYYREKLLTFNSNNGSQPVSQPAIN